MGFIQTRLEDAESIITVVDAQGSINDSTGKLSDAFKLAEHGFRDFIIEVSAVASAGTDTLGVWVLYSLDGTNFTDILNKAVPGDNVTIPNVETTADFTIFGYVDRPYHSAKLFFLSSGSTATWTVTARVRRTKQTSWQ